MDFQKLAVETTQTFLVLRHITVEKNVRTKQKVKTIVIYARRSPDNESLSRWSRYTQMWDNII